MPQNETPYKQNTITGDLDEVDYDDFYEEDPPYTPEHHSLYEDGKTAKERVGVIRKLRALSHDLPPKDEQLDELERLEELASKNRFYPTLGMELEVTEVYDPRQQDLFVQVQEAGIRIDYEPGTREYAHDAVHLYKVLTEEERALIELGLVADEMGHPMHLTVGGIQSEGLVENKDGSISKYYLRDPFMLARALEATGWCCSGRRLRAPSDKDASWDAKPGKSIEGVLQRYEYTQEDEEDNAQELPKPFAVEFRALELLDIDDLDKTLEGACYLGAALKARQQNGETMTDAILAELWDKFAEETAALFEKHRIEDPRTTSWKVRRQGYVYENDSESQNFERLAELLDQWEDQEGEGVEFVTKTRELVHKYCQKIQDVIPESAN